MPDLTDLPRWVLEVAFVLYAIVVTVIVLLERRRPTATLALVLALVFLPVAGLLAYLALSRSRVRRRRRLRQRRIVQPVEGSRRLATVVSIPSDLPPTQRGLVRLAIESAAAPLRRADAVRLIGTAAEASAAIEAAIDAARRTIHLEFYIWKDDEAGRRITGKLVERARSGVKVRVLYDHVGSFGLGQAHFAELRAAGGEVAVFGRLRFPLLVFSRSRLNFRNHRKILTVDGGIGFVGGVNIGTEYLGGGERPARWRDLLVEIRGDAVIGLETTFLEDWLATTGQVVDLAGDRPERTRGLDARKPAQRPRPWRRSAAIRDQALREANPFAPTPAAAVASAGPLVQVIPSGPDLPLASVIAEQFSAAIGQAQERAWIATPYFVPDEPLSLILRTAGLRGVDVRILVPAPRYNDQPLVALASRSYYDELLDAGCRIFEFQKGMLHSKYLVVDQTAAMGSANMDVRSFHINYEITAMFYDPDVARRVAEMYEADLAGAREVGSRERLRLSWPRRLAESAARVVSPLL